MLPKVVHPTLPFFVHCKFASYTSTHNTFESGNSLLINGKVNEAQLLVNKSAPVIETIISPTGNSAPATNFTIPGLASATPGIPPATITVSKPSNAIKAPPRIAIKANSQNGRLHLSRAANLKSLAAWAGLL